MTIHNIAGIDYGNGKTNINLITNIRYGVISIHNVCPYFLDSFEPQYPEITEDNDTLADNDYSEPTHYTYSDDTGLNCQYSPDGSFVWVFSSPETIECKFCSPCVPGAGDLDNPIANGVVTYALPTDCLNNNKE